MGLDFNYEFPTFSSFGAQKFRTLKVNDVSMCVPSINNHVFPPDFITFYSTLTTLESADITASKNPIIQANTFHCFNGEKDGNNSAGFSFPIHVVVVNVAVVFGTRARTENRFIFMLRIVNFFTAKPEQCRVLLIMY